MLAVFKPNAVDGDHICGGHLAVEVREQGITARDFPFENIAQRLFVHSDENQVVLACEMLGGGFGSLRGGREMDVAILHVNWRACGLAVGLQFLPFGGSENFVDHDLGVPGVGRRVKMGRGGYITPLPIV